MRLLPLFVVASMLAAGETLVMGPMVGHVADTSARVWLATSGPARIAISALRAGATIAEAAVVVESMTAVELLGPQDTAATRLYPATIDLSGLAPAATYVGTVSVDGMPVPGATITFTTAPLPGVPTRQRIAVVSCARCSLNGPAVWTALTADKPDVLIFLGNNNYFEAGAGGAPHDWTDPRRMAFRHAELRRTPALSQALRSVACYAIWDDHDYGPNDSDRTFALKGDALRLFRSFWANPSYGSDGADGVWSTAVRGDVQLVLCDDRFWRDPNSAPHGPDKTLLGPAQKAWLKRTLRASTARLKLVALGGQWLADYHRYESYAMFRHERDELLAFLAAERIPGVILLSGDRHMSELARLDRPGLPPLYELTASPAANRTLAKALDQPNPLRLGGYSSGPNYGLIDHDPVMATVTLRLKDVDGKEVLTHVIPFTELAPK